MDKRPPLAVVETHPVQYHAPVYRVIQAKHGIPVVALYGSDFSIAGYRDKEFSASFSWDTDLLSGYGVRFLSKTKEGGARTLEAVPARGVSEALERIQPVAVLLTGYQPRLYRAAFLWALRLGLPILFRAETTDHAVSRGRAKVWIRDQALRAFYRRCSKLLYIGQRSLQHYRRLGVEEGRLVFSPYCVETGPFQCGEDSRRKLRPAVRKVLGISGGQVVVLFSGKFSRRKGVDLLLPAVAALPPALRARVTVLIMGGGELEPLLRRQSRQLCLPGGVHFLGFQNQTRLSRYYLASDLLVLPSRNSETWGLVVNEALHHGLPALVSREVGCAPDLIEPGVTGELFKAGSVEALASAVRQGVKLTGNRRVRAACRRKVREYSVEKAAAGIARACWETRGGKE